ENAPPARCVAGAGRVEWAGDRHALYAASLGERRIDAKIRVLLVDAGGPRPIDQRRANEMGAGADSRSEAARIVRRYPFAVERDIQRRAAEPDRTDSARHHELVFGIQRKRVP